MMRTLLVRKLRKLAAPAVWRGKHDYFPRTLKLHNGEKVSSAEILFNTPENEPSSLEKDKSLGPRLKCLEFRPPKNSILIT